jgi:catechol 2,3-dioxygenase-like lactoylglutathione lyase family enzyme
MWWGIAVEAPDPPALAAFYGQLLGWPVVGQEDGSVVLAAPGGAAYLVLQPAAGYVRPTWPPQDGDQRPMMHLDFQVGDLAAATAEALALGAHVADEQPHDNVRVLLDPAGHPFCLSASD